MILILMVNHKKSLWLRFINNFPWSEISCFLVALISQSQGKDECFEILPHTLQHTQKGCSRHRKASKGQGTFSSLTPQLTPILWLMFMQRQWVGRAPKILFGNSHRYMTFQCPVAFLLYKSFIYFTIEANHKIDRACEDGERQAFLYIPFQFLLILLFRFKFL